MNQPGCEELAAFVKSEKSPVFEVELAGISYCDGTYRIARKNSSIFVFEYIIKGRGTVICGGERFHPEKGDVYILRQGTDHEYFADPQEPWTKIWVNVRGDVVRHLLRDMGLEFTVLIRQFRDGSALRQIFETAKNKELSQRQIFNACQLLLHQFILQLHDFMQNSGEEQVSPEAAAMKAYIAAHVEENIAVKTLAGLVHLSPSRAISVFRQAYHCTPYDYLLQLKTEMAGLLLRNTGLSVKEIALRLGYCDAHYFSNYFKRATGLSPTEYRVRR